MEIKKQNLQSVPVIAKLFGISERHVQRLAAGGVLPYESKRPYTFDLLTTIQAYIRYLKERIAEKQKSEEIEQAEYDKLRAEADLKQHKAAFLKMEEKHLEEQMIESEIVADAYEDLILLIREKVMQIPGNVADNLAKASSKTETADIMRKECFRILRELSEYKYDPEEAEKRRKDQGKG